MSLDTIPIEIHYHMLDYLNEFSFMKLAKTNKRLRNIYTSKLFGNKIIYDCYKNCLDEMNELGMCMPLPITEHLLMDISLSLNDKLEIIRELNLDVETIISIGSRKKPHTINYKLASVLKIEDSDFYSDNSS